MICGIVGKEYDAWDLAQEGFLKAWRSIRRFQGTSSFYTWLYTVAINVTIDSLRRRCRRSEVELDDAIPSFLPGPGVNYERAEIREQVYAALARLTPEHRAVFVLKEEYEMCFHLGRDVKENNIRTPLRVTFRDSGCAMFAILVL